ncbi:hypothetical protein ACOSP7_014419 [Xanthoceras sorbifolium]
MEVNGMVGMVVLVVRMTILRMKLKLEKLVLLVGNVVKEKKRLHHSSSKQKEVFNDITNVSGSGTKNGKTFVKGVFSSFSTEDKGAASRKGKLQADHRVSTMQSNVLNDELEDVDVLKQLHRVMVVADAAYIQGIQEALMKGEIDPDGGMIDKHGQKIALEDTNFEDVASKLKEAMVVSLK